MINLDDTRPLNLAAERAAFFASSTYEPQFTYANPVDSAELAYWGHPQQSLAQAAHDLLVEIKRSHPSHKKNNFATEADVQQMVDTFNATYHLAPAIECAFSTTINSQCLLEKNVVIFRQPIRISVSELGGVGRHELETHFLRLYNHAQRSWPHYQADDDHFRRTEEGLAILHTYLFTNRYMKKTFRTYFTTWYAQHHSFRETFNYLTEVFHFSPEVSWVYTVRAKRGLTDTSQPGGLTKDICYLEGALQYWLWLQNPDHNPQHLYLGRVSMEELPQYQPLTGAMTVIFPKFMTDLDTYRQAIDEFSEKNTFQHLAKLLQ